MSNMESKKLSLKFWMEIKMASAEGENLKKALDATIAEEKLCLEEFKKQINHCDQQLKVIDKLSKTRELPSDLMLKKKAFEDEKLILNVAALSQQCSIETKEKQKQLYFETDEHQRARLSTEASVLMFEWSDDLYELTGKKFQELAQQLLSETDLEVTRKARKQLRNFIDNEKFALENIRHNVGAHRDRDFMKQMYILEGIDWVETIERLHKFEVATLELGQSIKPLMDAGLKQIVGVFESSC